MVVVRVGGVDAGRLLAGGSPGAARHGERRVVDQQVDRAERAARLVDQPVDVVFAGEVGADRDRVAAVGLDGGHGLVDGAREALVEDLLGARHDRDRGALAAKSARDRLADPAACPGDDRDAARRAEPRSHHGPVLRAVGERRIGEEADHVGLRVRRDQATVVGEHVGAGRTSGRARRTGCACARSNHSSARNGSWKTIVCPTTPVDKPRCASSWLMPVVGSQCGADQETVGRPREHGAVHRGIVGERTGALVQRKRLGRAHGRVDDHRSTPSTMRSSEPG